MQITLEREQLVSGAANWGLWMLENGQEEVGGQAFWVRDRVRRRTRGGGGGDDGGDDGGGGGGGGGGGTERGSKLN